METIVWIVHALAALGVIGLVLLQHGKGADMGAAFGSGASGSLFGVSGSTNFLSRATAVLVAVFFTTSLTLAYISSHRGKQSSVMDVHSKTQLLPAAGNAKKEAPAEPPAAPSKSQEVPK
ncbi:MAG TPA: preprotein translocase subunit SecG [Novimethylophilus sp.]|jgi:preprotein translocase subunit SecG|uniref:preprotein translocase subunit SecG n=1 Tax=Novimethylophilus sp. TaxID=2137426 RepID=UPI002F3E3DCC